jgi:CHAT domain-containing protein
MLHDLPLHTLDVEGVPLIERNPVCYVPAASVLRHTLPSAAAPGVAAPGVPAAVFGDPRENLRHAHQEAIAVASLLGVEPVLGEQVTSDLVLDALGSAPVVHYAGHGRLAAADGFASSIDLADAGELLAADLLALRSRSRLVVLSGCQTGTGEQRAGDEIVGFTRALLLSGVRSILSSQWRVADASARDLILSFYQAAGGDSAVTLADALCQAVRQLRAEPRYSQLYHWGGFTLAGSWR